MFCTSTLIWNAPFFNFFCHSFWNARMSSAHTLIRQNFLVLPEYCSFSKVVLQYQYQGFSIVLQYKTARLVHPCAAFIVLLPICLTAGMHLVLVYRDDPVVQHLKPSVLKAYLDQKEAVKEKEGRLRLVNTHHQFRDFKCFIFCSSARTGPWCLLFLWTLFSNAKPGRVCLLPVYECGDTKPR